VLDDRPGSDAAVSVAGAGPLSVYVHVRACADAADLTGLRVLLTADLLVRAAELGGLQVLTSRAFTGDLEDTSAMSVPPPPSASARLSCPPLTSARRGRAARQRCT